MILRYLVTAFGGFGITLALFFTMQALISTQRRDDDKIPVTRIDFNMTREDSNINDRQRKLPDKKENEKPPPPPEIDMSRMQKPKLGDLNASIMAIPTLNMTGGPDLSAPSDGEILPLVRIEPRYPPRALSRGIEGWVLLEFTVSPTGTVIDPQVVDSEPSSIFNRAAITAVSRWKYKPKVVDGVPVPREGQQVVLTFKISEDDKGR